MRSYRDGLRSALSQLGGISKDAAAVDAKVGPQSPLVGIPLRSAGLPAGTIVMTVQRGSELVLPRGSTALEVGDQVGAITRGPDAETIRQLLTGGEAAQESAAPAPLEDSPRSDQAPSEDSPRSDQAPLEDSAAPVSSSSQDTSPSSTTPSAS